MSKLLNFIKARPVISAVAGVAALIAGVSAVSAQYGQGGWGHGGPGGHGFDRRARFERFCGNDTARYQPVARAFVKADLSLNATQAAEFDKFADVLLPAMEAVKAEACNNFTARTAPAPERFEKMAVMLRKAADAAEKSVGPAKSFYAQLDDKQKARVEEVLERRRMGFGHMGMGGMGMGMDGQREHHERGGQRGPGGQGGPGGPGAQPQR